MIIRDATKILKKLSTGFPIVAVNGPRQSGKTTIAKSVFPKKAYVSLENPTDRQFAQEDPNGFLDQYKNGAIIDEAQNCPQLFSYLQGVVDKNKVMGQYILTGSQQFGLLSGITQSLAGRVGSIELLPFSVDELRGQKKTLDQLLLGGFYPPVIDRKIEGFLWHEDYIKTYIERDVRQLINVKDLSTFQKFLKLCAGRVGQLLNISELGSSAGIDQKTAKSWLSVLEASYIVYFLRPHHKNFSKKLVKTSKMYFYDSGLLSYLLNMRNSHDLTLSPFRGQVFESMIISDIIKNDRNYRRQIPIHFWRDSKGVEIDCLLEYAQKLHPIEIKSGATIQNSFFKNLKIFNTYSQKECGHSYLVYGGNESQKRSDVSIYPWFEGHMLFPVKDINKDKK